MNLVAAVADNDQKISAKNSRENQKTSMSAQNPYITSILAVFESFLKLPQAAGTSRAQEQATLLLLAYLAHKQDYSRWNLAELEDFLEKSPRAAGFDSHPKQLVTQFVREYPPYQTSVLLHAYALALRAENCSYSTLKNYRSDINQFFTFAGETELDAR